MNYHQQDNKWMCDLCQREFSSRQATTSHIYRTHTNPGVSFGGHQKGKPPWNKGLTKETDNRVLENAIALSLATKGRTGRPQTYESKRKISLSKSINNKGGRCKWFEVAGQKVQGTWEQNIALKFEELGIKWQKLKTNQHTFEYKMDDKIRSYTPDFYLCEYDVYLEIKGRWWGRDKEKMSLVLKKYKDKKIVIIEERDYKRILQGELVWSFERLPEEQ